MLDQEAKQWLQDLLGANVDFDEPMARHTSMGIGGSADALARPATRDQLKALLKWSVDHQIPITIIGSGTNLLVRDGGIRGVTICLGRMAAELRWREQAGSVAVTAAAGVPTRRLCALALRRGWQGMNFALGIPGTLGGALCMNAGTRLGCMADVVTALTFLTGKGQTMRLDRNEIGFSHRSLSVPIEPGAVPPILLEAELVLEKADPGQVRREAETIMRQRARSQPTWQPSAGCFFRNPSPDQPAGRLIEEAGMKGAAVGDACVSRRHANFIINNGRATAADVLVLTAQVKEAVWQRFRIRLHPEVRIVGQDN
ncbi:MAG: UDP-N-acetylmuramate dehydrogenase [Desulfosarcinaceae bacterium]